MHPPVDEPITVPDEPVAVAGSPFPVLASIAPVVASVVIWSFTRSPFVLAFAALGPVIAVAGVVDGRWATRRRLRADTIRYRAELDRLTGVVDARHDVERRFLRDRAVGSRLILDTGPDSSGIGFGRWRIPEGRRTTVVVGYGDQQSSLRVDGPHGDDAARLRQRAAVVSDVPIEVDASGGIGIVGPVTLTRAFARGLLVQLCHAVGPDCLTLAGVPDAWHWAHELPHTGAVGGALTARVVEVASDPNPTAEPADLLLVLAGKPDQVPTRCRYLVELTAVTTALLHRSTDGRAETVALAVDLVSEAEAGRFARDLAAHARHAGLPSDGADLPGAVGLADLSAPAVSAPARTTLSAVIGSTGRAPVVVDIVTDGPHAIVGGTTGSGKSELLVTWVTSLADRHPPGEVNLLLVDFKGGAAFAPLLRLPHVVGVVTDLDAASATRALESLRAEVRFRERRLRDAGARDVSEVESLARLVIVVDEFAAMLDGYPDLHALFVDVAARGRSLGMHLILCTQRPAGVVKDSLLANCGLRMSLRVNNRADSTAILGTDAAASLPVTAPGRLALAAPVGPLVLQVASTSERDLDRVAGRWPGRPAVRKPWLDPLPARVERGSLAAVPDGIRLGLADQPAEQRQDTAVWRPEADGSLLVLGTARTGKTTLLDTIEAEAARLGTVLVERIGSDAELAWDVVHALVAALPERAGGSPAVLLLLDGLDSLLAGIDPEDASELRDGVLTLLRDGPRRSLSLVVTVQRLAGPIGALSGFVGSTVLLGTANRQEHVLAGGDGAGWIEARRPGSALWRGTVVQLCAPEPRPAAPRHASSRTVEPIDWRDSAVTLVVTSTPARRVEEIRALNAAEPSRPPVRVAALGDAAAGRITVEQVRQHREGPVVVVGDSDQWQAHWSLLTALREGARVVVDGCSAAEFRAVARIRARPPLLDRMPGRAWACLPGGEVRRVSLERRPLQRGGRPG